MRKPRSKIGRTSPMTTHKIKSGSPATSTIAAEPLPPRPLPLARRLILATICCAGVAWLVGPVGRLLVVLPLLLFGPGYLLERLLRPFPRQGSSSLQISNVTNLSQTIFLLPALWLGLSL